MILTASAPGKLVLSGEYAVLEGAPAIGMAVDRRARVTIESSGEDYHTVNAPGFSGSTARFRAGTDGFEWLECDDDFGLLEHVWQSTQVSPGEHWSITLDTSDFLCVPGGDKLGLGSSAALAVALARALFRAGGVDGDVADAAIDAHRRFQGGMGSGIDVACSAAGGLIEFTMQGAGIRGIDWPEGLVHGGVWAGVPADTRQRLEKLAREPRYASRAALVLASRRMAAAWASGSAMDVLDVYRDYVDVLTEFSIDHGLGIFDAGHAELTQAAKAAGVVYKPCGAGGGDTGVVLATDREAVDAFLGLAEEKGMQAIRLGLDASGARIDRESS